MKTFAAAALVAAVANAGCTFYKTSMCTEPYSWLYLSTGSYTKCMLSLGCSKQIDPEMQALYDPQPTQTYPDEAEPENLMNLIGCNRYQIPDCEDSTSALRQTWGSYPLCMSKIGCYGHIDWSRTESLLNLSSDSDRC